MKILFVTANRIGDAVLSSGILNHLIETYPHARITLACGPLAAPLFAATPNVVRIIELTKQPWAGHWVALWRASVIRFWDIVVDLRASLLAWLLPTRRRYVLRKNDESLHRAALYSRVLGLPEVAAPKLYLDQAHRMAARDLMPSEGPVLALGPTANWGGKQWPAERFGALAQRLTGPQGILPGARIAVLGAANERAAAAPVLESIPNARRIDLVGTSDLLTVAACLERAALYIGNDSGLMHMAAAVGTPTLGLFGPSREQHYAPWGRHAAIVRTTEPYEALVGGPGYDYRRQDSLMTSLAVEAVEAAAAALWRSAQVARQQVTSQAARQQEPRQ